MFSSGICIFFNLFLSVFVFSINSEARTAPKTSPHVDEPAKNCRKDICLLPNCKCDDVDIPGGIPLKDTPQIVLITFDDAVNDGNKKIYADLFEKGRKNPNGCPISATFYVTQGIGGTDYSQVQNLYAAGHEMASHTVTHSHGKQFSYKQWVSEVDGERKLLSTYGGVKQEDIRGMRAPYLEVGGDTMFKMLYDYKFTYDSSMPIDENRPPRWPYTLDYKLSHKCVIPPCPTKSYPGIWEVPMVVLDDLKGGRCSMVDFCSNSTTSAEVYKMFMNNFERHYTTNRAPLYVYFHPTWFAKALNKQGFISFLDKIVAMNDVWVVTNWQAIQWIKKPTPLGRINNFAPFGCNHKARPKCSNPKVCRLQLNSKIQYVKTCQICPKH